jgi:uncharacterized GH25 family protein
VADELNFSIKIVDNRRDGISGARVTVFFAGLIGTHSEGSTDSDGWVEFVSHHTMWGHLVESVYVDGEKVSEGFSLDDDGETFSFTI